MRLQTKNNTKKFLMLAIGLLIFQYPKIVTAANIESIDCADGTTYRAGQIQLREEGEFIKIQLRSGDSVGTNETLARELGIELPPKIMPVWAELSFAKALCKQKPGSFVTLCTGNVMEITFKEFSSEAVFGHVYVDRAVLTVDVLNRNTLAFIQGQDRVEAKLEVTLNATGLKMSSNVEMSSKYCKH